MRIRAPFEVYFDAPGFVRLIERCGRFRVYHAWGWLKPTRRVVAGDPT